MSIHLLIIDAQNDFCDPSGALHVAGADADMKRLADFIEGQAERIDRISATLDSHNKIHIAHPIWWKDRNGNPPEPFTRMSCDDVRSGRLRAAEPAWQQWAETYMKEIGTQMVWPYHCLIGTWGCEIYPDLKRVLDRWRDIHHDLEYIVKGSNRFTEHFSAVKPAMEVPGEPYTRINTGLIRKLDQDDAVWIAGEASSHCVADTVSDIVAHSDNPEMAGKITLITDAMSPVGGFEKDAEDFFARMRSAGARLTTTEQLTG